MPVADGLTWLKTNISKKAFTQSLFFAGLVYILISSYVWYSTPAILANLQQRLATQTVLVEWIKAAEPKAAPVAAPPAPVSQNDVAAAQMPVPDAAVQDVVTAPVKPMANGLVAAPLEGLYETTELGRLPVRRKDGMSAFSAYRRPFDVYAADKPLIAIAVMNIGLSDMASQAAVNNLPQEVSIILSPYATGIDFWNNEARGRGHETWLELPVETDSFPRHDPGPHTVMIGAPEKENMQKLDWILSRTSGYVGTVASLNPAFLRSNNDLRPVIGSIYTRGLAFIDTARDPGPVPQSMAIGMKAPYAYIDILADEPATEAQMSAAFAALEKIAGEKGMAIGIIRPFPLSLQQTQKWIKTLDTKGIGLAPLSAMTGQ